MHISEMVDKAHANAIENGWWDGEETVNVGEKLMLIVTEAAEAMEDYRNGVNLSLIYGNADGKPGKPGGFPVELADIVIRVGDLCGKLGIDLEHAIKLKMAYNAGRPYRHGGKLA